MLRGADTQQWTTIARFANTLDVPQDCIHDSRIYTQHRNTSVNLLCLYTIAQLHDHGISPECNYVDAWCVARGRDEFHVVDVTVLQLTCSYHSNNL